MYQKLAEEKERKQRERNPEKFKVEKVSEMYLKNGQIRQCNEGKYRYSLKEYEDPDYSFFEIDVPKHLQTRELDVNLNPNWVSVRIKKQLTQIKFGEEIIVHESKSERSQITGSLLIKMKKLHPHEFLRKAKQTEAKKMKKQEE